MHLTDDQCEERTAKSRATGKDVQASISNVADLCLPTARGRTARDEAQQCKLAIKHLQFNHVRLCALKRETARLGRAPNYCPYGSCDCDLLLQMSTHTTKTLQRLTVERFVE